MTRKQIYDLENKIFQKYSCQLLPTSQFKLSSDVRAWDDMLRGRWKINKILIKALKNLEMED